MVFFPRSLPRQDNAHPSHPAASRSSLPHHRVPPETPLSYSAHCLLRGGCYRLRDEHGHTLRLAHLPVLHCPRRRNCRIAVQPLPVCPSCRCLTPSLCRPLFAALLSQLPRLLQRTLRRTVPHLSLRHFH